MRPCPAPDGSQLPAAHRPYFAQLVQVLLEHAFRADRIKPLLPGQVELFVALAPDDEQLAAWCDEIEQWLHWYRVPAYWLAFVLQLATQRLGSLQHLRACTLYADAQTHFADDLALSSLETAWQGLERNAAALGAAAAVLEPPLRRRLQDYLDHLAQWTRPFGYIDCNPLADHLETRLAARWLAESVADEAGAGPLRFDDAPALASMAERAAGDARFAWHGVVARRFLGLLHAANGRHDAAAEQYRQALAAAREHRLDTQIGHLRRLLGQALRELGRVDEARHEFEQALAFERLEPFFAYTFYWQALSARELGDTWLRLAGRPAAAAAAAALQPGEQAVQIADRAALDHAGRAYHDGRLHFDGHLAMQCPFPLARAAKQQMLRSFSTNAVATAAQRQDVPDLLAELEGSGPREATGLVAEIAAAVDAGAADPAAFRRNRALVFATLNTTPPRLDEYLAGIAQQGAERRAYLQQSIALGGRLASAQRCDEIVARVLALRLPDTVFLLFHLGPHSGTLVLLDLGTGLAAPFPLPFGEQQLRPVHERYEAQFGAARNVADRSRALEILLAHYATLLGPTLEPMLRFFPGKHVKIFPRLQMNAVPLHALPLRDQPLLQHCAAVSYGQTLGLFLQNHALPARTPQRALRCVLGRDVPWYEQLLPGLRTAYGAGLHELPRPRWPELLAAAAGQPARDTLFACHGHFDAARVADSALDLGSAPPDEAVSFARVFAELDLHGCRSVLMGSCESGLARTEVAAEYLGLPAAMLACGVHYVVGALWTIPQVATALLVERLLQGLADESADFCAALAQAQRHLIGLRREQLAEWVAGRLQGGPDAAATLAEVAALPERPFATPYHWAGLQVVGDR